VVLFWALPYMIHMGLLLLVDRCLTVGLMTFVNLPSIAEALDGRLNEVVIRYLHLNRSRFALRLSRHGRDVSLNVLERKGAARVVLVK
jgi:hypothetical protein